MRLIDYSADDPAQNLALDEALLNEAETGNAGEALRFWESPIPFVVLGLTQGVREEVREEACAADGVPILRRCSAGGCVLQQEGCLNFSLILDRQLDPNLSGIRSSYESILGKVVEALGSLEVEAKLTGISDLAVAGRKISGNAQRRRKRFILHQGTLLYGADLSLCGRYLKEPSKRPEYRAGRSHAEFLVNLPCEAAGLKGALGRVFLAAGNDSRPSEVELEQMLRLVSKKYGCEAWNRRI